MVIYFKIVVSIKILAIKVIAIIDLIHQFYDFFRQNNW